MTALDIFPPTRTAALERLSTFLPRAGRDYAARRNYDGGPGHHTGVSTLSPYLRCRVITEDDVLQAVLARHSAQTAEKFIQEVFWRTYWKGWLELRPSVWDTYKADLQRHWNDVQTQSGLRARWDAACMGTTGIACFDAWVHELTTTGYLHNHARMWFASIWIFTLDLPWELGADFFLRHLLDGDPASNTLGWRWVAGVQTVGKTYAARADNIAKYTEGRFDPRGQLAPHATPRPGPPAPAPTPLRGLPQPQTGVPTGVLLHEEDLSPRFALPDDPVTTTAVLTPSNGFSPLTPAPHVAAFRTKILRDTVARWSARLGDKAGTVTTPDHIIEWANATGIAQIVTPYAPVGPVADVLSQLAHHSDAPPVVQIRRPYDSAAWPHATKGFFAFKKHIPDLVSRIG
ncbi:FAD-binding domain-containing protein [Roseobacter sp.]|uniref:FAD-binding domain-containing protein n=1 Tax=Roseobacter sp. TaxID=1907202 RepID=UPI003299C5E9